MRSTDVDRPSTARREDEVLALGRRRRVGLRASDRASRRAGRRATAGSRSRRRPTHRVEPGAGASALLDGEAVRVGRPDGLPPAMAEIADEQRAARADPVRGLARRHPVRPAHRRRHGQARGGRGRSRAARLGLSVADGDRATGARPPRRSQRRIGIDACWPRCCRSEKVEAVRRAQAEGRRVAFVGDGLNDAPAARRGDRRASRWARAPTSRSPPPTSPCSADRCGPSPIALDLARRTYRIIQENLFWAFVYNVVMIPLAVVGVLDPMWAAAAMAISSVTVVLNALRLRRFGNGARARSMDAMDARDRGDRRDLRAGRDRGVEDGPRRRRPLGRLVRAVPHPRARCWRRWRQERDGAFTLAKIDVDAQQVGNALLQAVQSQSIPTVIAFRDGAAGEHVHRRVPGDRAQPVRRLDPALEAELEAEAAAEVLEAGDTAEAEAGFRDALAKEPGNREAALGLARILLARGAFDEARPLVMQHLPDPEAEHLHAQLEVAEWASEPGRGHARRGEALRPPRGDWPRGARRHDRGARPTIATPPGRRSSPRSRRSATTTRSCRSTVAGSQRRCSDGRSASDAHDRIRAWWDADAHVYDDAAGHALSDPVEAAAWRRVLERTLPARPRARARRRHRHRARSRSPPPSSGTT